MTERSRDQGVTLRRIWNAWCSRCGWSHDYPAKIDAQWALGSHNVNRHGGTDRMGAEL